MDTQVMSSSEVQLKRKVPWLCSQRIALAVLGCAGFAISYGLRVNLSVAIVCMVNHTALNEAVNHTETKNDLCQGEGTNQTEFVQEDGELSWSKPIQGLALSSFFWGYVVTQVPGGWLSARLGGKRVIGWSTFLCASINLLMPTAAKVHAVFLMVLRVITGFCQGCIWSSILVLWAYWAPPLERSYLVALPYSGAHIGNVITFPMAGVLCKYGFAGGWPSVFYTTGAAGIVWFFLWMYVVYDTPEMHPRISTAERNYIQKSLVGQTRKTINAGQIPWLKIIKSPPVWALVASNVCCDWTVYTFLTNLPTYMKEVLQFNLQKNALLSCLPFLALFIMSLISSSITDKVRSAGLLTTTAVRKINTSIGLLVPAIVLIALGYIDCTQHLLGMILLILAIGFLGVAIGSGFNVNHTDIAPKYASVTFGITNGLAAIPGFVAPTLIGIITKDKTQAQWRTVFFLSAAICTFGAIVYVIAGSGELQAWAKDQPEESEETHIMENKLLKGGEKKKHENPII